MESPVPSHVHYHKKNRLLELTYPGDLKYRVPIELLRVYSPSAEVRGHSADSAVLQTGKRDVGLMDISQVGNYALKLHFDDGHDSGLYSYDYLYKIATHQDAYWAEYLQELSDAGASREPKGILFKEL